MKPVFLLLLLGNLACPAPALTDPALRAVAQLFDRHDYREASDLLEKILESRPRRGAEAYIILATCRLNLGQKPAAVEACERGLRIYPDTSRLQKHFVFVLRAACTKKQRAAKLEDKYRQKPGSLVYQVGLGEALLAEDVFSPRIEPLISTAVRALPNDAESHYLYGRWACLNDRQELAVRELRIALGLSEGNEPARMQIHTFLGVSYDHLGQIEKADEAFRASLAINQKLPRPEPGPPMEYVGFLQRQQREDEVQAVVLRILKMAPEFGPAHLERANFYVLEQRMEEALVEGELALRYAGTDSNGLRASHALLARINAALGRMEQAQVHREWIESH